MQSESLETSLLSILALLSFFTFLLIQKFSHKIFRGILLDNDFEKPQAFHSEAISRIGGLASIISFNFFLILYSSMFSNFFIDYFWLGLSLFFIGFIDDLKVTISPKTRLSLMIITLIIYILFFSLEIVDIDLIFLQNWFDNKIFSTSFILLCFLFIINGSNLIDGFNGLLALHLIIINSLLFYINVSTGNSELSILIISQIMILIIFLFFNFPKAKIFLGDSGSYFFGSFTALNTIYTNNANPEISSFFFCILLFYLFFEVFFSFFRKLYQNKSPLKPDKYHLHMLAFNFVSLKFNNEKSNYFNSILINISFIFLMSPGFIFKKNGTFCKYWFFSLLIIYLYIYLRLYSLTKKKIDI